MWDLSEWSHFRGNERMRSNYYVLSVSSPSVATKRMRRLWCVGTWHTLGWRSWRPASLTEEEMKAITEQAVHLKSKQPGSNEHGFKFQGRSKHGREYSQKLKSSRSSRLQLRNQEHLAIVNCLVCYWKGSNCRSTPEMFFAIIESELNISSKWCSWTRIGLFLARFKPKSLIYEFSWNWECKNALLMWFVLWNLRIFPCHSLSSKCILFVRIEQYKRSCPSPTSWVWLG